MGKNVAIFASLFLVGLIILIWPDKSNSVFRFNESHGPSVIDLIGLILIFLSWGASMLMIINRWKGIIEKSGLKKVYILLSLYLLFVVGIILALANSIDWVLWLFSGGALMINILFVTIAFQIKEARLISKQ